MDNGYIPATMGFILVADHRLLFGDLYITLTFKL
jgi:hypothetical protein